MIIARLDLLNHQQNGSPDAVMIAVFGLTMIAVSMFDSMFNRKIMLYLLISDITSENKVEHRKATPLTCPMEFLVAAFAVVAVAIGSYLIGVFLVLLDLVFWGVWLRAVRTVAITYQDREFVYITASGETLFHVSGVENVRYESVRWGEQLRLDMKNGCIITLHQRKFVGLRQFYDWLASEMQLNNSN